MNSANQAVELEDLDHRQEHAATVASSPASSQSVEVSKNVTPDRVSAGRRWLESLRGRAGRCNRVGTACARRK